MNSSYNNIDYWVACSGGVDSVVLVRLFKALNKNFGILHCNFQLRGEASKEDENFVRDLANEINVPLEIRVFNIGGYIEQNGGNTQLAARDLRYEWFEEIKNQTKAKIVLGHHQDDQIETFLLQLKRGGKVKGLSCMKVFHNDYVRPLLNHTKEDIYFLARKNNWMWREDLSNKKSDYLRNFYRNDLIPIFQDKHEFKSTTLELVTDFQDILIYAEHHLNKFDFSKELHVSFDEWDGWSYWIKHLMISKSGISPLSVAEVDKLRVSEKGKYLDNGKKTIWNEGAFFVIKYNGDKEFSSDYEIQSCGKDEVVYQKGVVFIDRDKVSVKLTLRAWRAGESFQPLGLKGKVKVSKFLRDKKIPSSMKENYPVIVDQTDQIVGVVEICPGEQFKLDENSKRVYRIVRV